MRGGFATADIRLWDDGGRLLATGTQMMILRSGRPTSPSRPMF